MSKVRVYDLAKELKVDSKKVMDDLRRLGVDVRVASNTVEDDIAARVRQQYFPNRKSPVAQPPAPKLMKSPPGAPAPEPPPAPRPSVGAKLFKVAKPHPSEETPGAPPAEPASYPPPSSPGTGATTVTQFTIPPPPAPPVVQPPPAAPPTQRIVSFAPAPPAPPVRPAPETPAPLAPPVGRVVREFQVPPPAPPPAPRPNQAAPPPSGSVIRSFTAPVMPRERFNPTPPAASARADATRPGGRPPAAGRGEAGPQTGAPAVPGRTTYIPSQDPNHGKGKGRRKGRPMPGGRRTDNERTFGSRSDRFSPPVKVKPVYTEFKPIKVMEGTTVKELAEKLEVKPKDMVAALFGKGIMATINQTISDEAMREVAREFGFEVSIGNFEDMINDEQDLIAIEADAFDDLEPRAPVVAVMGHVDHGKTSLLDAIRNTRVAAGEAGGITQHIGAYTVNVADPDRPEHVRRLVFLDTPGHEAFTMMRARGAKGADVAVIVVAADDGVMPQTIEAVDHARAAGVPLVVAINKIDKPQANIDRVKNSLAEIGLQWDGWGGDTVMVEISAKQRTNLDGLLEMILLTSDILNLKAATKRLSAGVVLEARLDKGRGSVASVLVQQGTLKVGDPIIVGLQFGRVRALIDDRGRPVLEAGPSVPVEVLGLQGVPKAGDLFQVVKDPTKAQEIATFRQSKFRLTQLMNSAARGLEDVFEQMKSGNLKELLVILKADVQGSVEVLRDTLQKLSTEKVKVRVIRSDVGAITESDVLLASASNDMAHTCIIIGFNVRPAPRVSDIAKQEKVDIRLHSIIYKVEEEMRKAMVGMLDPLTKEVPLGRAIVRQVVKIPKVGNIGGCYVEDGIMKRSSKVRVIRDSAVVYEGEIGSLRRFKDDASEVKTGFECGISIDRFSDIKVGDIFECYMIEKVAATEL
jgi:translation initiation factor IF-2